MNHNLLANALMAVFKKIHVQDILLHMLWEWDYFQTCAKLEFEPISNYFTITLFVTYFWD